MVYNQNSSIVMEASNPLASRGNLTVEDDFISVVMAWNKENLNPAVPLFTNNILGEVEI